MTSDPQEIIKNNSALGELVSTADGSLTIRHPGHLETYHSSAGAETEARELYINASGISQEFAAGSLVVVLDVGLGLAYNAMATIDAWMQADRPGNLTLISLEHKKQLVEAMASGEAPWSTNWANARKIIAASLKPTDFGFMTELLHPQTKAICRWEVLVGDARETIIACDERFHGRVNYVWQDPFSPEKNPGMWNSEWFRALKTVCDADVVLMTYSVARQVRDALSESGWSPERFKTPVREKKHWLRARIQTT